MVSIMFRLPLPLLAGLGLNLGGLGFQDFKAISTDDFVHVPPFLNSCTMSVTSVAVIVGGNCVIWLRYIGTSSPQT